MEKLEWERPLQIVTYPDPRLRAVNARVNCFDESLVQLAKEMVEVMYQWVVARYLLQFSVKRCKCSLQTSTYLLWPNKICVGTQKRSNLQVKQISCISKTAGIQQRLQLLASFDCRIKEGSYFP